MAGISKMECATDNEVKRLEGLFIMLQDQVRDIVKIQKEQAKSLALINQNLAQLNTALMGIPGTGDKGLVGIVNKHESRLSKMEKLFWTVIGALLATNVINAAVFWF